LNSDAEQLLIEKGNGDLRATLNALELAVLYTYAENGKDTQNKLVITQEIMADSIQVKSQNFDANGDGHYDLVSAFQKSIRGSD
ncbi:recombination factor protein RarA, partial [Klebsiella pneumoniae]|nr:recombination factor protein RarA [Klebsiella pneumoniae]